MDAIMQLTQHSSRKLMIYKKISCRSRTVKAKNKCTKKCDKGAESLFCLLKIKPSFF